MTDAAHIAHKLFVGIRVPPNVASLLADFSRMNLRDATEIRWSDAGDLHVTLNFLGPVPDAAIEQLSNNLGLIRYLPFEICLEGADFFEDVGVLFVNIQNSPSLFSLQKLTEQATLAIGVRPDERPYRPHISLARINDTAKSTECRLRRDLVAQLNSFCKALPTRRFPVEEIVLYETVSGHYQILKRFRLASW